MNTKKQSEQPSTAPLCLEGHEWVVYSTALREHWMMVQCVGCGATGTVDDPSPEEWSAAYFAPSRPYRWHDGTRVTERGYAAPCVIRAVHGSACECPSQRSLPENQGYDRVPGGIWQISGVISEQEKAELLQFANFVGGSDLCSRLLPTFLRCCENDTGHLCSRAIHTIIDRIEAFDNEGLHCSSPVVAWIIREFAIWESREAALAEKVASMILAGESAHWLHWLEDGHVKVVVRRLVPARSEDRYNAQKRRVQFQEVLAKTLAQKGWSSLGSNIFARTTSC
jgi:hypothetical protein